MTGSNKLKGRVVAICIAPRAGEPMQRVERVEAIAGAGLKGDRYGEGAGSFNKDKQGARQVTFINAIFFEGTDFRYEESRRNIITEGVELMWLIGREFTVGKALFLGVKYCDPCGRPSKLAKKEQSFKEVFFDRGGLIAEVLERGVITVDDTAVTPSKGY